MMTSLLKRTQMQALKITTTVELKLVLEKLFGAIPLTGIYGGIIVILLRWKNLENLKNLVK